MKKFKKFKIARFLLKGFFFFLFLKKIKDKIGFFVIKKEKKDSKSIFSVLHDHFIPHKNNEFKAKLIHFNSLVFFLVFAVTIKFGLIFYLISSHSWKADMAPDMANDILLLINQEREDLGLGTLTINNSLSQSAEMKANDMIAKDYFAHKSPGDKMPWDWIDRGVYPYIYVGENLAMQFSTSRAVHRALMNSPTHKKNIINEKYSEIGLAIVDGEIDGKQTKVLVQLFASRKIVEEKIDIEPIQKVVIATQAPKIEEIVAVEKVVEPEKIEVANVVPEKEAVIENKIIEKTEEVNSLEIDKLTEDKVELEKISKIASAVTKVDEKIAPKEREQVNKEDEKSAELVMGFTNQSISNEFLLSPNKDLENNNFTILKSKEEQKIDPLSYFFSMGSYYFLISILVLLIIILSLNVFIKMEVQHKSALIQLTLLIAVVASFALIKWHNLEGVWPDIYII